MPPTRHGRPPGRFPVAPAAPAALVAAAFVVLLALLAAAPVAAQRADFLFERPNLTLAVLGGWAMPGEDGDLFEFTRKELTVSRGDFASPLILLEAALRVTERFDLAVGFEHTERSVPSEMRDWVTQDDLPITQTTEFQRQRLMATVKGYLFARGRRISELAWVPARWSPYAGAGVGLGWYEFVQHGDFVDFQTLDIFADRFRATGRGTTGHVVVGADVSVSPRFILRGEYRYIRGTGALGEDSPFEGFEDLDLSGSRASLGVAVRM